MRIILALGAVLLAWGCTPEQGGTPGDDDTSTGDDDASQGDDDTTGDDDSSSEDDTTGDDDSTSGDGDEYIELPGCLSLAPVDGHVAVLRFDLNSEAWSEVERYGTNAHSQFHTQGLTRLGNSLIANGNPTNPWRWLRFDLADGTLEVGSDSGSRWVSGDSNGLVILHRPQELYLFFADYEALDTDDPSGEVVASAAASRHTVVGNEVFSAAQSAGQVDVHALADGSWVRTIDLEGFDTWIWGIAEDDGSLYLLDPESTLWRFDASTGALIDTYPGPQGYSYLASGLWCETG